MKGNINLFIKERDALCKAIIEKYLLLTGKKEYEHKLNLNPSNYNKLVTSIKEQTDLGIESNKPMVNLFREWQENVKAFRKEFIEKLYKYAHNMERQHFLKLNSDTSLLPSKINKNISGFWECYYDEDNSFHEEYTLKRFAIFIPETVATTNTFEFHLFGMGNSLDCSLEVCSANIVFSFRNFKFSITGEPAHFNVNFGSDLRTRYSHPETGVGVLSFLSQHAAPTACICLLKYFPERDLDYFNSLNELPDLILQDGQIFSPEDRKIKNFFANIKEKNFVWAHAHYLK